MTLQQQVGRSVRALRESAGFTQEELAARVGCHWTYISGIERGRRNVSVRVLENLARAFGVAPAVLIAGNLPQEHPMLKAWSCSAEDVLDAIAHGFRAQVDVKGKLAELFLARALDAATESSVVSGYEWKDRDADCDFLVMYRNRQIRVECKNVRSGKAVFQNPPAYKVEVQKTRNSKDGTNTRAYRFTDFDALATCLFNQTGRWEFLYAATRLLVPRPGEPEFLDIMQPVPMKQSLPWRDSLADALSDVFHGRRGRA